MKKPFAFSALCALLYAMPACANFFFGESLILTSLTTPYAILVRFLPPILLILLIQTFFLRLALPDLSYQRALLAIFIGNIPSAMLGAMIPEFHERFMNFVFPPPTHPGAFLLFLLFVISNTLLMLITIAILFRYPVKKLIMPLFFGNVAAYVVALIVILMHTPGCCGH